VPRVDLKNVVSDANTTIYLRIAKRTAGQHNYFDAEKTEVVGTICSDEATGTFTFDVTIAYKASLKP